MSLVVYKLYGGISDAILLRKLKIFSLSKEGSLSDSLGMKKSDLMKYDEFERCRIL